MKINKYSIYIYTNRTLVKKKMNSFLRKTKVFRINFFLFRKHIGLVIFVLMKAPLHNVITVFFNVILIFKENTFIYSQNKTGVIHRKSRTIH